MELGSRVASQKIGPPLVGEVYGFVNAAHWARSMGMSFKQWTDLYPDWLEGRVVFIFSDVPSRGMTLEEYGATMKEEVNFEIVDDLLKYEYATIPKSRYFVLPEADLVTLEEVG